MARNTRQRRRQRRRAQGGGGSGGGGADQAQQEKSVTQRARARQQAVRPSAQPQKSQTGARRVPGSGLRRFVSESWAELKKVEWPTQNQVIQGTIVVIIACGIVGLYLWVADLIFKPFVRDVLLTALLLR
jgi:preprotein translocase subunit SecE